MKIANQNELKQCQATTNHRGIISHLLTFTVILYCHLNIHMKNFSSTQFERCVDNQRDTRSGQSAVQQSEVHTPVLYRCYTL